ncbi:MAG: FecR family protein, partial [Planctomycetota bacterium]
MNQKHSLFDALQSRHEGHQPSAALQAEILAVAGQLDLQQEIVQDAQIDGALRIQPHITATADDFVARVEASIHGKGTPTSSAAGRMQDDANISDLDVIRLQNDHGLVAPPPTPLRMIPGRLKGQRLTPSVTPPPRAIPASDSRPIATTNQPIAKPPLSGVASSSLQVSTQVEQVQLGTPTPVYSNAHSQPVQSRRGTNSRRRYNLQITVVAVSIFVMTGAIIAFMNLSSLPEQASRSTSGAEDSRVTPNTQDLEKDSDGSSADNASSPVGAAADPNLGSPSDEFGTQQLTVEEFSKASPLGLDSAPSSMPYIAQIVDTKEAQWARKPGEFIKTEDLHLIAGQVQLRLINGVELDLVGPAQFSMRSDALFDLKSGQLTALVPPPAVGFTVTTPASKVVDLGTEFSVSVDDLGATGVRVLTGEVEVESTGSEAELDGKWSLRTGDFKWVDANGASHDWNLTLKLNKQGLGSVLINGQFIELADRQSFELAKEQIFDEFQKFEKEFVARNDSASRAFSGIIDMAGSKVNFEDLAEYRYAKENADKQLRDLETLLGRYNPNEIFRNRVGSALAELEDRVETLGNIVGVDAKAAQDLTPGISRSPDGSVRVGQMTIGPGSIDFGGIKFDENGFLPSDGTAQSGVGASGDRESPLDRMRQDRNRLGSQLGPAQVTTRTEPLQGELILNVSGAGGRFRLRTNDSNPITGTRTLRWPTSATEIEVSKDQRITINVTGAGNEIQVPEELRQKVQTNVNGAGNEVEFFTPRIRARDRLLDPKKDSDAKASAVDSGSKDSLPLSASKTPNSSSEHSSGGYFGSESGSMMIVISGGGNKVTLEVSDEEGIAGIRSVHGVNESAVIPVGPNQHVTVYLDGVRNEAIAPAEIKSRVAGRLNGVKNKLLFRNQDGKIIGGFGMQSRSEESSYPYTRKGRNGSVGTSTPKDKSTLLFLVDGWDHDVI